MGFFSGTKGKYKQISNLTPNQQLLQNQLVGGASGGFNDLLQYYQGLMSGQGSDINAFMAPEMRNFNENIIPGLSEQFAGMGSGALSSSGFRNAAVQQGVGLQERLAQIRANLRSQGAQGIQNLVSGAMQPTTENIYEKPQPGFMESVMPGIAEAGLNMMLPGAGTLFKGVTAGAGKSSPYGNYSYKEPLSGAYDTMMRQQGWGA